MVDKLFTSTRFSGNATLRDVLNGRALLKRNSSGEAVKLIQKALIDLGESMPAGADGSFGPQTQTAVTHFQSTRGLGSDGIVGPNTMSRLDADIVLFDTPPVPPPPTPVPVLKTLRFWIKAFIPDPSVTPYVVPSPGASAGQSNIEVPYPNLSGKRCFLGDNRGFSSSPTASARIHALVDITNLDVLTPTLGAPDIRCGESLEIDPTSGVVIARDTAPHNRCFFSNLRANETADPNGGIIIDSPSPNFVQLDFVAAANLPLLLGSPDIDMFGTLQIDRDAKTFAFKGMVDGFPCFEAYVSFNGGAPVNLFKVKPITPLQLIGGANRSVDTVTPIVL
ncbi:hypothetical protein BGZ60DRAFT_438265 [Tricladium varicosporioides]|nr:hypothetical protein BGZ60DRAFT_438265 [Hymenoscyphus varicosporioides]